MRNLIFLLLLVIVGWLAWEKTPVSEVIERWHSDKASVGPADFVASVDAQISKILSPIASGGSVALQPVSVQQEISKLRHDVREHFSDGENSAAIRATDQMCDLLLAIATERNEYIRRMNETRTTPRESSLVSSGTAVSGRALDQSQKQKSDATARREELEGRVKWWEASIQNQWSARAGQLRKQTEARYSAFRASLDP